MLIVGSPSPGPPLSRSTARTEEKETITWFSLTILPALQKDVDNKQSEIKVKKDKLADIKQVRQDLIEMGEYDFQLMQRSLDSIIMIWDSAKRDANDVM